MSADEKMKFKDFIFPVNPSVITIAAGRRICRQECAYGTTDIGDFGERLRVVSGEGEFFGQDCMEQFEQLKNTMGGVGRLFIPLQNPMNAVFEKLELKCEDVEGVIRYVFQFVESREKENHAPVQTLYGNEIDCLWDYADRTGTDIDLLVRLNPHIQRPDRPVRENERIYLC